MRTYSANFKEKTQSTSGEEPSYLLEITHAQLVTPIRMTNDAADIVSNGNTFIACQFRVSFPDDLANVMPRVTFSIDNIGREMTQWLDASMGGKGAQFRCMQIMRDAPNFIEQDYTLGLLSVHQGIFEISGALGYEDIMSLPALAATQTPEYQPAIF